MLSTTSLKKQIPSSEGDEFFVALTAGGKVEMVALMIKFSLLVALSALIPVGVLSSCSPTGESSAEGLPEEVGGKIGVYDSRAIAAADAGSPRQEAEAAAALAKLDLSGQEDPEAYLDDEAHTHAQGAHDRAYGTEPVDDILAHIEGRLPGIMKEAGVIAIVSKWDEKGLKKYEGAERVDVTMALVDALEPTKEQREFAVGIQKRKVME